MGEIEETLVGLGLTSLQAKIYVALNSLNEATVKDISKVAKVARQEIYRALFELLKLGMIEKRIAIPNRFRAVPLKQVLEFLLERRKSETTELEKKTAKIIRMAKAPQVFAHSEYDFLLLEGKELVLRSAADFFAASRTIKIINESNLSTYWWINQYQLFVDALNRGARIQVLIDKPQDSNPAKAVIEKLRNSPLFEIRYLQLPPSIILVIYDQMGVLPIVSTDEAIANKEYVPPCLCSNHPAFAELLRNYFDNFWVKAAKSKWGEKTRSNSSTMQTADHIPIKILR